MAYNKQNPNGQATMANSSPVVVASDQSAVPVTQTTASNLKGQMQETDGSGNVRTYNSTTTTSKYGADVNILSVLGTAPTDAGKQNVQGSVATNVAVADKLLNIGVQGVSSENSAVTAGRMVQLVADLVGKQIVLPYANPENFVSGVISSAMTGTTSTSLVAAPGAGLRNYITTIIVSNSHATVGTDILIQDGSGGTTLMVIPAAAAYGGATITLPTPLRQPTANTALYAQNVTTGSNTKVSAFGYKGA